MMPGREMWTDSTKHTSRPAHKPTTWTTVDSLDRGCATPEQACHKGNCQIRYAVAERLRLQTISSLQSLTRLAVASAGKGQRAMGRARVCNKHREADADGLSEAHLPPCVLTWHKA